MLAFLFVLLPSKSSQGCLKNSQIIFGVYHSETQTGFARLITDFATFAYLCDVCVLEEYQGEGPGDG
ncbi:hypothetical protein B1H58_19550 [Pantoea alhagi]|uniref:N-acetyltransferase domain-containing protein n=1 Tax=Pantoea alhagi TaxID=1891675 RepID=A0A1W6BAE4_9GAMM|nr:hypothetical protein B1H58_19550 [Pantoea alhagi]